MEASLSSATVPSLDKTDFLKLQNGSDIRGVAVPGVEGEPVSLPKPVTEAIAAAFGQWLLHKKNAGSRKLRVSVGHDSRISAPTLLEAVSRGLGVSGVDVVQFGLASTPAMFNSTLTEDESFLCPADGAIMITASHLPYNRNGFKFFTSEGGLGKVDIKNILERAADIYHNLSDENLTKSQREVSIKKVDYMAVYTSGLVNAVRKAAGDLEKPLEGFHIVVDAGNGAGGFFAAKVLEPLGAITSGSQFLEPDGMFPNHIPNPEDKTAMQAITKAVLDNKADLGIIFDTDVDRSAAVDSSGREFNRNRLIALLSAIVLEEHPGTTIVTDSVTSDGLTSFIEKKLGGKHHRFKRGYKNVIDEAIRLNSTGEETHLAIETSGHGALKENHWLDDGAYLMVKILNKLASARAAGEGSGSKVLTDLVEGLDEPKVALELRLKIDKNHSDLEGRDFREYGETVLQQVSNSIETNPNLKKASVNYEGIRVSGFGGWFLLRLSLHDPVLPLTFKPNKEQQHLHYKNTKFLRAMGLNLNPILRQELANLDKDTESRKTAMKALKSYVKDLDSKAIPSFLAQVSETKETNSLSGEYTISLYEILARVHGPNIVPQIDTIMSTIVKTLASSAGSFPLQQACSKVVPAIARYGIDPTEQEENKKRSIIHSLCKPLSDSLLCSQESLASGSALCLKALVDCDNWRFASDEMVNKVCQNVVVALDANSNQTHLHMGLVMALAKRNPLIVEAYARLLIHTGVRILGFGVKEGNSQKRLSAVQMINFLMKCLDPRSIYSEVELIVKEMERCQTDQMAYVRGAAYEAMVTSKRIAGELEGKMEKKGCRSVTGSNFGGRKCSPDDNESLSPESQTLGGSFSGGYDSPVESSPRSSCNFDGRSVNRKLWRSNGVVDISLKDGLFSGDTTVSDSPLVPYDHCDNEFEGFVMGSLRNRRMQNTTPTSPQRQCCSRNMNAEDFNIYSTPRKLISSLQYPDDMGLDHSDIQSPMPSRQNTKLRKQSSPTPVKQAMETISSSSTVMFSEETTPQSQMIMSSKKKRKNMSYGKLMFAISFFVVVLFTSVMMFSQDDDVVYYTVPT